MGKVSMQHHNSVPIPYALAGRSVTKWNLWLWCRVLCF